MFLLVYKHVRMETLKNSTFIHWCRICFSCQVLLTLCGFNSLTLSHWWGWPKPVISQNIFTRVPSQFVEQDFLPIWQGNNGVRSLVWGMLRVLWHLYSGWNGHSKNWYMGQHTCFSPPCCELSISRMKRGGVEVIMASHIFKPSLVWSVVLPLECWHWLLHTPYPLHWTFHPLSSQEALGNVCMNVQSLLFTHPRRVLPVLCWTSDKNLYFVVLPQSHFPLEFVSLGSVGAPGLLSLHKFTEMSPLCQSDEKKSFLVEDPWMSCSLVLHEVGRDPFNNLALHFVWFLLSLILHFLPHPVGIGFSQDQVTWFWWNNLSFPIIVLLLSLCFWLWTALEPL